MSFRSVINSLTTLIVLSYLICVPFDVYSLENESEIQKAKTVANVSLEAEFSESQWYIQKEKRSRDLISQIKCDVIIPPLRADRLDFIERALFSKILSIKVSSYTDLTVLDPTLLEHALRSDQKIPSNVEIFLVAKLCGAKNIIIGDVISNKDDGLIIKTSVFNNKGEIINEDFSPLKMDHTNLPYNHYGRIADSVIDDFPKKDKEINSSDDKLPNVPLSIDEAIKSSNNSPLDSAFLLQYIAMMHQGLAYSRGKEDLFERSLALTELIPVDNKWRNLIIARALTHLHRRPAALEILSTANKPEELALIEFLNGNESTLEQYIGQTDSLILKHITQIEQNYLRVAYFDKPNVEKATELFESYETFGFPLYYSMMGKFSGPISSMYTKMWLDFIFPLEGRALEPRLESLVEIGKYPEEQDFVKWTNEHIDESKELYKLEWRENKKRLLGLCEQDFINLAGHMVLSDILKSLKNKIVSNKIPDSVHKDILNYAPYYSGNPQFNTYKGWSLIATAENLSERYNKNTNKEGRDIAREASYWGRYQRFYGPIWPTFAHSLMNDLGGIDLEDTRYKELLFFPPRDDRWLSANNSDRRQALADCVNYSITGFQCMIELKGYLKYGKGDSEKNKKLAEEFILKHQNRFKGFDRRFKTIAQEVRSQGDFESYENILKTAMEQGSADWFPYYEMGLMLLEQGKFKESIAAFLQFPGFSSGGDNRVAMSANANSAASKLFWKGAYEESKPLFEIAANSRTGSASQYSAQYYLAILNSDYTSALDAVRKWVGQYESKYAYRNLIHLHYMFDNVSKAESIFDLAVEENEPHPWVGAFVGRGHFTPAELVEWAKVPHRFKASTDEHYIPLSFSQRFIFMTHVIDRLPDENTSKIIYEFNKGPEIRKIDRGAAPLSFEELKQRLLGSGYPEMYSHELTQLGYLENVSEIMMEKGAKSEEFRNALQRNQEKSMSEEVIRKFIDIKYPIVQNKYVVMTNVIRHIYLEEYQQAYDEFNKWTDFSELREFMPYLALISGKTGSTTKILEYLEKRKNYLDNADRATITNSREHRFEYYIINAYLEGTKGNHQNALEYLKSASFVQPYMEQRSIFPMYQVVEAAELLYRDSKQDIYKTLALDLARRNSIIQPMYAWSHAVVANYTDDPEEKMESLTKAIKLDPYSYRANKLPEDLIKKAKVKTTMQNPFLIKAVVGDEA